MQRRRWQAFSIKVLAGAIAIFLSSHAFSQDNAPVENPPAENPSAPKIVIHSPAPNQKVNAVKLLVKGEVTDDGEVVSIIIGDVSLGVSGSKIPFQYPVYLKSGKNEIRIEAVNSQGNRSVQTLTVFSDSKAVPEKTKQSVPVAVSKSSSKTGPAIPEIPSLPSKTIIVKKEDKKDYVKITPNLSAEGEIQTPAQTEKYAVESTKKTAVQKPVMVLSKASWKKRPGPSKPASMKKKTARTKSHWNPARKLEKYVTITPRILINDRSVSANIQPVLENDRTYVALEDDFVSKLGVQVVHDRRGGKQYAYLIAKGKTIKLQLKSSVLHSNGNAMALESPLRAERGKLMVPFRTVCEQMGFYVTWDPESKTASAHQH